MNSAPLLVLAASHYLEEFAAHPPFASFAGVDVDELLLSPEGAYEAFTAEQAERLRDGSCGGVVGLTDAGALVAAHIEELAGWREAGAAQLFAEVMHKLRFRHRANAAPGHVPLGAAPPHEAQLPAFVKPVHSSLSFGAGLVRSQAELDAHLAAYGLRLHASNARYRRVLRASGVDPELAAGFDAFFAEEVIPTGVQVTADAFVDEEGSVTCVALTESMFDPTGQSFVSFDMPARVSAEAYAAAEVAVREILRLTGICRMVCNLEFVLTEGSWYLVELNPRPATQFAHALHLVTGWDTLTIAEALARRAPLPERDLPRCEAASIQIRRTWEDAEVLALPDPGRAAAVLAGRPGARYNDLVRVGNILSELPQDGHSYRYGELVLPHSHDEDPAALAAEIFAALPAELLPVPDVPAPLLPLQQAPAHNSEKG